MSPRNPAEEEAWRYIVFRLENDPGFWFGLLAGDDRRPRKRLRDRAEAWCKAHGMPFFEHMRSPGEMRMIAVDLSRDPRRGLHWIVADGPEALAAEWDAGVKAMLMAMNERRDAYRRHLAGGLVMEGRLSLKPILRDFAPDMFSIRAFVVETGTDPAESIPVLERPAMYHHVRLSSSPTSVEALLARAERLAELDDPDALRLRGQAIRDALVRLLHESRWSEVRAVADRFAAEMHRSAVIRLKASARLELFLRAVKIVAEAEVEDPTEALSQARTLLAEIETPESDDGSSARAIVPWLARIAEIQALRRLLRFEEAIDPLRKLADLFIASLASHPHLTDSTGLSLVFDLASQVAWQLQLERKWGEATTVVSIIVGSVERARERLPDDSRWALEHARALLLRADHLLFFSGDLSTVLQMTEEVLAVAREHAETDSGAWARIRWGAQSDQLFALWWLGQWQQVAELGRICLDDLASAPASTGDIPWMRVRPAIFRAHALQQLGASEGLAPAVDEALHLAAVALAAPGEGGLTARMLPRLWLPILATAPNREDRAKFVSLVGRLKLAERVLGAALSRFSDQIFRDALLDVMKVLLAGTAPGRSGAARARLRLRRRARAIRRWREGKRLHPFVHRYVKQLRGT